MKILIIRSTGGFSGAEKYNLSLLQGILNAGSNLEIVFLTDNKNFSEKLANLGITVYINKTYVKEVGTKKDLLKAFFFLPCILIKYVKIIRKLEKIDKFNVICIQSMTEKIFLTPILKILHYKIIWIEHGPLFVTDRFIVIKKMYLKISTITNKIITVSDDTRKDLISNGVKPEKTMVISSAIDTIYFTPLASAQKEKIKKMIGISGKFIVGYCGGINKEKGIEEFLQTAKLICKKRKDIIFLLVGKIYNSLLIKERIEALGVKKYFVLAGFQYDPKDYLGVMDIFFFPTNHYEGLSMALLEAAAMKLLIITHDIGGNKEIVLDGETGFLYENFDAKKISNLLLYQIKNIYKYETVKLNAQKLVKDKYDIQIMAKKYQDLFMNL